MYRKIFLADDDCDDQELFRDALKSIDANATLMCFNDGLDLLDKLLSSVPALPQIVFLYYNMPRLNGTECVQKIRAYKELRDLPIVIMSTSGDKKIIESLYDAGANRYIVKAIIFSKLRKSLHSALSIDWTHDFFVSKAEFLVSFDLV